MCEVLTPLVMVFMPLTWLFFFWFGYWWFGRRERLNEEILRAAYDVGVKWMEEWKAAGKPVGEWPGLRPPIYWNRNWDDYR